MNEKDYYIKNFGMNVTNPFITVQGIAGGSHDASLGDEGYEAYVFDTDKGMFQITISTPSSDGIPNYSTARILSNQTDSGDCLLTEKTNAKADFDKQTVQYVDSDIHFTKVKKALAILVSSDDPDEECSSGEHIRKIISVLTKQEFSQD